MMVTAQPDITPYARALAASRRARWDLEDDVFRGRSLDATQKFLPDRLSLVRELPTLTAAEARFFSQVQGRTYANLFGLVERFIGAKILEMGRQHALGDQVALEALIRFSDEELKHQEMFRRVETMAGTCMPRGYRCIADPNEVAELVLQRSTWAVLALTCHIELFTLVHYKESIAPNEELSPLFKDVFRFHWMEESQHAVLDELEWRVEDARLTPQERDAALTDLIDLVGAVDGILQAQAAADANYFADNAGRNLDDGERERIAATMLKAYRFQYILSGIQGTRFGEILGSMLSVAQSERVQSALAPLM